MKNCKKCGKKPDQNCDEFFGWLECPCGNRSEKTEYFEADWIDNAYETMMSTAEEFWDEENK